METYIIRYRISNGSWQEMEIVCQRPGNDPWLQAYAMFGKENVLAVLQKFEQVD